MQMSARRSLWPSAVPGVMAAGRERLLNVPPELSVTDAVTCNRSGHASRSSSAACVAACLARNLLTPE